MALRSPDPSLVREYSTLGGISEYTSLLSSPSETSLSRVSVSVVGLIPDSWVMISLNRNFSLFPIRLRTNMDHFLAMTSIVPLRAQRQTSSSIILGRGIEATHWRTYPNKYYGFCSYPDPALVVDLDSSSFDRIIQSGKTVLVDFWAEWCGYCKIMDPIVESVAAKYQNRVVVGRMNADENLEIARRLGIQGLPVFIVFSKGQPVCSLVGAAPRQRFESWFEECLEREAP
jgi:thioredoxin 1